MKRFAKVYCFVYLSLLILLGALCFILPQRDFSDEENRMLKTASSLSAKIKSGDFQDDLESLLSDQFPLRTGCVKTQTSLKLITGRQDIGGAYIGKNGYLYQKITDADVSYEEIASHAGRYARIGIRAGDIRVTAMPVPSAGTVNKPSLPKGGEMYDYEKAVSCINENIASVIDLKEALTEQPVLYYATDHHWTAQGAYIAYNAWCEAHSLTPFSAEDFSLTCCTKDFKGTLSSKIPGLAVMPDSIFLPSVADDVTLTADGSELPFYDHSALEKKDKYAVYMSGNHAVAVVECPSAQSEETLLIIKDSFANSVVPYLTRHYIRIILIDERFATLNIAELAQSNNVSEIAIIKEAAYF